MTAVAEVAAAGVAAAVPPGPAIGAGGCAGCQGPTCMMHRPTNVKRLLLTTYEASRIF